MAAPKAPSDIAEFPQAIFQHIFEYCHGGRSNALRFRLVNKKWKAAASELRVRWACGTGLNHEQMEKIVATFPNIIEMRLQEASLIKNNTMKLVEKLKLLQSIGLPPIATDADVEWLCTIPQAAALQGVSLRGTTITNKTLKLMSEKMKSLKKAEFECTGHKSFDELATLPNLQVLILKGCSRIGDDALDKLSASPSLSSISVDEMKLTPALMKAITHVKTLKNFESRATTGPKEGLFKDFAGLQQMSVIQLSNVPIGDEDLLAFGQLKALKTLILEPVKGSPITDKGVQALGGCAKLKTLALRGAFFLTSKGAEGFSTLTSLRKFQVTHAPKAFDDDGIKPLHNLPNLTKLFLGHCDGFHGETLHKLQNLVSLKVSNCKNLTFKFYKYLSPLRKLEVLSIDSSKGIDSIRFKYLLQLTKIRVLHLSHELCMDRTMKHLTKLTGIQVLTLKEAKLTNEGLQKLTGLPRLRTLNLVKCGDVNKKGVKTLQAACPNLTINYLS